MKVVMCIAGQKIAPDLLSRLEQNNFRVTQLASEGGFMRRGNTTYLIGVKDDEVSEVLNLVKESGSPSKDGRPARRALAIVLDAEPGAAYMRSSEQT
mgnify:CR=1 FL=1